MKKIFCLLILFCLISCTKDDDGTRSDLPSETTEGKNTFGCRVDDITFLPKSSGAIFGSDAPIVSANYFKLDDKYYDFQPGYYLRIVAMNEITNKDIVINATRSDLPLAEGKTYPITMEGDGLFSAKYSFSTTALSKDNNAYVFTNHQYKTSKDYNGELKITKIDESKLIISGTFSFDCYNDDDQTIAKIRESRFDIKYKPYLE
ncbi:hypothetical protein D0809_17635 [Flavobacterium circumlabens]|uniref:Uncharacterized protein n=1 Tax=Flavobacterium circumlabens TaxID=2133765 RepID=A0A4Y7UBN9_9FLAO|nr:DUF6252 family protein [Flavobacterium circumlabens]TEB43249.1 hypothetical protein D0809_17635 [Flavobacterium circumlabens]